MQKIKRKFLLNKLPDICFTQQALHYERHFLTWDDTVEERIQRKGDVYQREKKTSGLGMIYDKEQKVLSAQEFATMKQAAIASICRKSYLLSEDPAMVIKVYDGHCAGLIRAEVEFSSVQDAHEFVPLSWMGLEITDHVLGRDSRLVQLGREGVLGLMEGLGVGIDR